MIFSHQNCSDVNQIHPALYKSTLDCCHFTDLLSSSVFTAWSTVWLRWGVRTFILKSSPLMSMFYFWVSLQNQATWAGACVTRSKKKKKKKMNKVKYNIWWADSVQWKKHAFSYANFYTRFVETFLQYAFVFLICSFFM